MKIKPRHPKNKRKGQMKLKKIHSDYDQPHDYTCYGGLSLVPQLARKLKFEEAINTHLDILKIYQNYRESDHLFHLLNSIYIGGSCIEDLSHLQSDATYMKMLNIDSVPDPTTMGDFLRRFKRSDINNFKDAVWQMRQKVWMKFRRRQRRHANLDLDSRICPVYGNQKRGANFSYKKTFSYHPEFLTLAETGEWLDAVNRSGNEISGSSATYLLHRNLPQAKEFYSSICVRGDSKYGRADILEICQDHQVNVCVGWPGYQNLQTLAEELPEKVWRVLDRRPENDSSREVKRRKKGRNLRRKKARKYNYRDKKLQQEHVAEFNYIPSRLKKKYQRPYRLIVIRKQIEVAHKTALFDQYEYYFTLTDLPERNLNRLVRFFYQRSNQENLIEQAKNGVSAFRMPTGDMLANEVWMLVAMLAHNFKNWITILALGKEKVNWKWKRFRMSFVYVVGRITKGARQLHLWLDPAHRFAGEINRALFNLRPG